MLLQLLTSFVYRTIGAFAVCWFCFRNLHSTYHPASSMVGSTHHLGHYSMAATSNKSSTHENQQIWNVYCQFGTIYMNRIGMRKLLLDTPANRLS